MAARFSGRWDVRTGSPRKLWRALHDFLDDNGFIHEYHELVLAASPIEGTATFSDELIGYRDHQRPASLWLVRVLLGVLLCLTIVLFPFGSALLRSHTTMTRSWAMLGVEGEVYRTRGANMGNARASETLDVVADARITLEIVGGEPAAEDPYRMDRPARGPAEVAALQQDFQELQHRIDGLLPRETLPSTELREV